MIEEWTVVLVGEGPTERRNIQAILANLADRVGTSLRYETFGAEPYLKNTAIDKVARKMGLSGTVSGHGGRGSGDRRNLRLLFQILVGRKLRKEGVLVVWARDTDGDCDRSKAFEDIRNVEGRSFPRVVAALAHECGEAWMIAGWQVEAAHDSKKLRTLRQELGFDPVKHPERLSHKENVPKSAKMVLSALGLDDEGRQQEALLRAATLGGDHTRGCGLHKFCEESHRCFTTNAAI